MQHILVLIVSRLIVSSSCSPSVVAGSINIRLVQLHHKHTWRRALRARRPWPNAVWQADPREQTLVWPPTHHAASQTDRGLPHPTRPLWHGHCEGASLRWWVGWWAGWPPSSYNWSDLFSFWMSVSCMTGRIQSLLLLFSLLYTVYGYSKPHLQVLSVLTAILYRGDRKKVQRIEYGSTICRREMLKIMIRYRAPFTCLEGLVWIPQVF